MYAELCALFQAFLLLIQDVPIDFCCNVSILCLHWRHTVRSRLLYAKVSLEKRYWDVLNSVGKILRSLGTVLTFDSIMTWCSNTLHCCYSWTFLAFLVGVWVTEIGSSGWLSNPISLFWLEEQLDFWWLVKTKLTNQLSTIVICSYFVVFV